MWTWYILLKTTHTHTHSKKACNHVCLTQTGIQAKHTYTIYHNSSNLTRHSSKVGLALSGAHTQPHTVSYMEQVED